MTVDIGLDGIHNRLPEGKEATAYRRNETAAGQRERVFSIESEAILVSLYVVSVSGTLNVSVATQAEDGHEKEVITFPTISNPSTELLLRKSAISMERVRLRVSFDGPCEYEIRVRGVSTGEASVRILGANEAHSSQTNITTTPTVLVPSALSDRAGLVIKNYDTGNAVLFIGFTLAEADSAIGYPIGAQESLGVDVAAGQAVYAVSGGGTIDVRIMEASS